ncbi:MAG: NAD(P)H-dependent oxidoreductase [Bdellovibrionales bacterium]|nr:NAD(P)H-dependent oxidoreductase [Bdellovibrionales bacterium]
MRKNIVVITGHPNQNSFCRSMALAYIESAKNSGHEVVDLNLIDLSFDPILRGGYSMKQELEKDLIEAQERIRSADHLVFIYPNWWGAPPALLKGFIDRVFLPGFAFKYVENSMMPMKLLKGKTVDLLITMDTPIWMYKIFLGSRGIKLMNESVIEFCGMKTKKTLLVGPIRKSSDEQRTKWIRQATALASRSSL